MQYDEFIGRVQKRADLGNPVDAERITEAVLGTLGELIYRTERRKLAAQLPRGLQEMFYKYKPPENIPLETEGYSLEEFYHRVQARAGRNSYHEMLKETKAVIGVLEEAVSEGEIADVKKELPNEFTELFQGV